MDATRPLWRDELNRDALVQAMVGRAEADLMAPTAAPRASTAPRLSARGLRTADWPAASLDIDVAPGEIVGIAGLVGAGRTELLETIFGLRAAVAGDLHLDGDPRRRPARGDRPRASPSCRRIASNTASSSRSRSRNVALATVTARSAALVDTTTQSVVAEARSTRSAFARRDIEQLVARCPAATSRRS